MVSDALTVLLEGKPIGNVERLASGALRLRYDEGYRDDPTATLLSVSMPPTEAVHGDARVRPWLWGLLPDNATVPEPCSCAHPMKLTISSLYLARSHG